ncbi:hypothetical protein DBR42_03470 [Pelomonas sp. HMWF004]|nr:hypothetical protein DBR42_03470 [Pelomonas sp. HMWF004]
MTQTLGICIPTYKRPAFLRRCVTSALEAAKQLPVRVFIADDSLDDSNQAVYEELQIIHGDRIVVRRNARNLGIDENIQACVEMCDCDYAWIVGEDDYFLPNSVPRILAILQETQANFLFANYAFVGDQDAHFLSIALDAAETEIPGSRFVSDYLWAVGFIGACVVKRRTWSDTSAAPYKDTYYTHVGRICQLLAAPGATVRMVLEPNVANRVEGTDTFTWKHDSYGVFFGFKAMCETVARELPAIAGPAHNAARVMERRYRWLSLRVAMRLRSECGYDRSQYIRYLAPHTRSTPKRWALYLISITPPAVFRPLVAAYRLFR